MSIRYSCIASVVCRVGFERFKISKPPVNHRDGSLHLCCSYATMSPSLSIGRVVLLSIPLQYGVPLDMIRGATTRVPPDLATVPERGWRPWSQKNASVAKKSLRMSTCTTAPPAFRKRTWSARNDSSVCYASMSRSPAAMARRVFLSRSTKWRRDDEPLEPQVRCPSRIPSRTRVERGIHHGRRCNCRSKRARRALRG